MLRSKLLLLAVLGAQQSIALNVVERQPPSSPCNNASRRRALTTILSPIVATACSGILPANAAPPMSAGEADNVGARFERSIRKKPPKVLRNKLNLDFAVLLMRSSYNALDELDAVAMDQFQRDFFLIRQAEYQPYVGTLGPGAVRQGELTDPAYFDFISFAQYATINREIANPETVFEEQQPVEVPEGEPQKFLPVVIKRKIESSLLPTKHGEMVGDLILNRLNEIFGGTEAQIPTIDRSSDSGTALKAIKQLCVLFLINGFAFDGNAVISKEAATKGGPAVGTEFTISFTAPATLWSGQALQLRKVKVTNDFFLKTASTLLRRAGYVVSNPSVKYTSNQEITTFTIV